MDHTQCTGCISCCTTIRRLITCTHIRSSDETPRYLTVTTATTRSEHIGLPRSATSTVTADTTVYCAGRKIFLRTRTDAVAADGTVSATGSKTFSCTTVSVSTHIGRYISRTVGRIFSRILDPIATRTAVYSAACSGLRDTTTAVTTHRTAVIGRRTVVFGAITYAIAFSAIIATVHCIFAIGSRDFANTVATMAVCSTIL